MERHVRIIGRENRIVSEVIMSSTFGKNIKISVFGQSHSEAIGVVIDGLPSGEKIDLDELASFMARRAPSEAAYSTKRREGDNVEIVSGLMDGYTCGAPLTAIIRNTDTRSSDYEEIKDTPRPGHADLTGYIRYGEHRDWRGGGHFSGRLTAPLCVAGGICKQLLERQGIMIGAHILKLGGISDTPYDPVLIDEKKLFANLPDFPVKNPDASKKMRSMIALCKEKGDSVGGIIECGVIGCPAGIGDPMFDGLENRLSAAIFAIPAVKGIEFGDGFALSEMRGSVANDAFVTDGKNIATVTNHSGGINGGITNGMPIIFRTAIKPTPSIAVEQSSVSISKKENKKIAVGGRHDPCILPRAVPVVEAMCAVVLADYLF